MSSNTPRFSEYFNPGTDPTVKLYTLGLRSAVFMCPLLLTLAAVVLRLFIVMYVALSIIV
jgi:hypothetical protein